MSLIFQRHFPATLSLTHPLPLSEREVKDVCPESRLMAVLVDEDVLFWEA